MYIDAEDPDNGIDAEYHPKNDRYPLFSTVVELTQGQNKMSKNTHEFKVETVILTVVKPLFILYFGHFILSR